MRRCYIVLFLLSFLSLALLAGCGGGSSQPMAQQQNGTVFLTGSDGPPLPSVVAFQITIDNITLFDSNNNPQVVLSTPTTVEFARFLGLRTLLGLQSVPAGTYTSAKITLQNPVISYLSLNPVAVNTLNGFFSGNVTPLTLTVPLNPGLTVGANGLAGVHMDFDLRDSLVVDANGLTGQVNPVIRFRALHLPDDEDAQVDELRGSVASVNVSSNSFVLQRVNGRQFTIDVNAQTDFEGVASSINNLAAGTIVEVSGRVQADGSLLADAVQSYTTDREFLAGIILNVTPASGAADSLTVLVRDQIPVVAGISVGNTTNVAVDGNTVFGIYRLNLPITAMLFNRNSLVLGQAVGIGGVVDTTTNPPTLDARRVILHRQGLEGQAVQGSINVNQGTLQLQNNALWGFLFSGPLNVLTSNNTRFVNVSGLAAITPNMRLRVTGLLLRDSGGNPLLVAGRVENVVQQ